MNGSMRCLVTRSIRLLAASLSLAGCLLMPGEQAISQTPSSPQDLLQMFRSLPPEQQDAILKQLGGGGGGGISAILGSLAGGTGGSGGAQRQGLLGRSRTGAASESEQP